MTARKHNTFIGRKKDKPVGKQSGTPAKKDKGKKPQPTQDPKKK